MADMSSSHFMRTLVRQMNAPVLAHFDIGCDHDLPGVTVGIGEISGIAAIVGLVRWFQKLSTLRDGKIQHRIDFLGVAAVPGSVAPRKACGRGFSGSVTSCASWFHGNSPSAVPPVSKNATTSPVARNFRANPSAS